MKTKNICGTTFETNYDERYKCIDLELVKVYLSKEDKEGHYQIHIDATLKNKKFKNLLKLHIKDAIELKSIIDCLVYDANEDKFDIKRRLKEEERNRALTESICSQDSLTD